MASMAESSMASVAPRALKDYISLHRRSIGRHPSQLQRPIMTQPSALIMRAIEWKQLVGLLV